MGKLAGKVAIITGSSAGIGRATALLFAQEGASVTIHGRNEKSLQETQNQLKAQGVQDNRILVVQGPIEEAETCENLVNETIKKFGKLDVLVNNAGIGAKPGLDTLSLENFDYTFDVNLKSVVRLIQLSTPHLEKTQGNIVNVSSIAAIRSSPNPFYASAKAALDHLSRGYSLILAPKGIRINVLNPGAIDTEFGVKRGLPQEQYDKFVDAFVKAAVPMNRIGTAEEMAKIILFLAVDATYMTGDNITAGGGCQNYFPLPKVN
uniref:3-oxoacyl-[acyl-carrier-protein] reductase FabG n=1 Tax=Acrobeloides nanus TaxID=290746 RepID=A0A914DLC2_9BILA